MSEPLSRERQIELAEATVKRHEEMMHRILRDPEVRAILSHHPIHLPHPPSLSQEPVE